MRKLSAIFGFIFIVILYFFAVSTPVEAAVSSLTSVSDTITTSRPSAASPLSANAASATKSFTIYNNGSRFLASDSARILRTSTGATIDNTFTIASQSADLTTIYLPLDGSGLASAANNGTDVLVNAITAMHTIQFTTTTLVPSSGKIVITFPGAGANTATPSATTFSWNGLSGAASGTIASSVKTNNANTCTFAISAASLTCTTSSTIAAGTVVTFLIGCSSATGATCNTQAPFMINPTKTAVAGSADSWKITITTQDSSSNAIDQAKTAIGTIESVQVSATVDPTLSFTIAAVSGNVNTGNTTGCTNSEAQIGGSSTATTVDMGILNPSSINIVAQLLTVSTNAVNGYTLTATSAGHLINPVSGYSLADDSTLPGTAFAGTGGTTLFGIHACGLDVSSGNWGTGTTPSAGGALYAWPTQTSPLTLASRATGPVGNTVVTGSGLTTVEYGGTVDGTVPAGAYQATITYVATATF